MHDPMTQAFVIPFPWFKRFSLMKDGSKGDKYRPPFITIWHVDPENGPGGDDSCGWFMRAHHGDKAVLEKIVKRFEFDWDRVFTTKKEDHDDEDGQFSESSYFCGYFKPDGQPHYSVQGIAVNLFLMAAMEHFESYGGSNWKKAKKFVSKHLLDILLFAENPCDSLHDGITRKFGRSTPCTKRERDDRIRSMAACIYGWILRAERPWWKHPRWHVHHWKIQVHPWQTFRRWALSRCCKCGERFNWGESPCTDQWHSREPKFMRGEEGIYHAKCGDIHAAQPKAE